MAAISKITEGIILPNKIGNKFDELVFGGIYKFS
jgi:hypothetical protein